MNAAIHQLNIGLIIAVLFLSGCSTLPRNEDVARAELNRTGLAAAQHLLKRAERYKGSREVAMVYRLRAGELVWEQLFGEKLSMEERRLAQEIYNSVCGLAAVDLVEHHGGAQTFNYAGYTYHLEPRSAAKHQIDPARYLEVFPAKSDRRKGLKKWFSSDGMGEPLIPIAKLPADEKRLRFVADIGTLEEATAMLHYGGGDGGDGGRRIALEIWDPSFVESVRLNGVSFPLAADFSAPLQYQIKDQPPELLSSLSKFFVADESEASLTLIEPYDPDRIPVVFVHGLISEALMWKDVYNELRADPEIRKRYQFWFFRYPTGWPVPYSAHLLRKELAALEKLLGDHDDIVMIGHSMGGILTRYQVTTPGRLLWDATFEENADKVYRQMPKDSLARKALVFEANPDIERVVFISTPHRGSKLADFNVLNLIKRMIKLPGQIMRTVIELPLPKVDKSRLTSVESLSPENKQNQIVDLIPIEAHYHSIIGDRGRGDSPNSSDGVVEYWSSHLDGAESELIVPAGHGAHDTPESIAEIARILELNLQDVRSLDN